MWLYFQPKIYTILRGPDYVIVSSGMKSKPFWGDLTLFLNFPAKYLSHSERTWLCDYTFQPKTYPILRGPDYVIILPAENLYHSERTWLCDCILRNEIKTILRGPNYVFKFSSQIPIPFWADLTMWLYFLARNFSHFEGTWLCDCVLSNEIYDILMGPDYVIILSS